MSSEGQGGAGGGLNERTLAPATTEPLSGTGGSAGAGTRSGEGEPSGSNTDRRDARSHGDRLVPDEGSLAATGELAGIADDDAAAEAAALGSADGSLADASGGRQAGPSIGDALGSAGRDIGSGTPNDRGDLGGGGALGQHAGTGPASAASPGGDSRR